MWFVCVLRLSRFDNHFLKCVYTPSSCVGDGVCEVCVRASQTDKNKKQCIQFMYVCVGVCMRKDSHYSFHRCLDDEAEWERRHWAAPHRPLPSGWPQCSWWWRHSSGLELEPHLLHVWTKKNTGKRFLLPPSCSYLPDTREYMELRYLEMVLIWRYSFCQSRTSLYNYYVWKH